MTLSKNLLGLYGLMQTVEAFGRGIARSRAVVPCTRAALFLLIISFAFAGCTNKTAPPAANSGGNQTTAQATPAPTPSPVVAFDGGRAFEHVRKQVEIGPRPAGSQELGRAREYIMGELKSYGLSVSTDEWTATTPLGSKQMVNVIAELKGETDDVVMLASHYDTKYYKQIRFVGANDSGSSTGAVMELARVVAARTPRPRFTYRFVFFDGEEAFCEGWEQCKTPDGPDNTYGSRRMASQLQKQDALPKLRAMILLDMIGYSDLTLGRDEEMSKKWLLDTVWQTARDLGFARNFVNLPEPVGGDDHEPFFKLGVPCIDLIQLETYPFWHTEDDTLDKISPQSLKIIGDVVLTSLPRIEEQILSGKTS